MLLFGRNAGTNASASRSCETPIETSRSVAGDADLARTRLMIHRSTAMPVAAPIATATGNAIHQLKCQSITSLASTIAATAPSWACARLMNRFALYTSTRPTASNPIVNPLIEPSTRVSLIDLVALLRARDPSESSASNVGSRGCDEDPAIPSPSQPSSTQQRASQENEDSLSFLARRAESCPRWLEIMFSEEEPNPLGQTEQIPPRAGHQPCRAALSE